MQCEANVHAMQVYVDANRMRCYANADASADANANSGLQYAMLALCYANAMLCQSYANAMLCCTMQYDALWML